MHPIFLKMSETKQRKIVMKFGRLIAAVIAIVFASGLAKFGNENYEMLKEAGGLLFPIAFLLGALIIGIYGIRLFIKAFSQN